MVGYDDAAVMLSGAGIRMSQAHEIFDIESTDRPAFTGCECKLIGIRPTQVGRVVSGQAIDAAVTENFSQKGINVLVEVEFYGRRRTFSSEFSVSSRSTSSRLS